MKATALHLPTFKEAPADAEVVSHKLMTRAGMIRKLAGGIYTYMPLGLRVIRRIEAIIREEMDAAGAIELLMPVIQPAELWMESGRWEEYGPELLRIRDRHQRDFVIQPTSEEVVTDLARQDLRSYRQLPKNFYHIQTKFRDERRPRFGIMRGREFTMKDAYSFDIDDAGLDVSYQNERDTYERIFKRLGLEYVIVSAMSGAMGGSRSEEFLHPSPIGEDTFVRSPGGYAANAEAVVTPAPDPIPFDGIPAVEMRETPNAPTIDALVERSNELYPREDRPWQASDTLKSFVVTLTHPDGEREVMLLGVPGDRDVDMKRLEASVAPAEVEMSTPEDLAKYPELVPGYIGPMAAGPNSPARHLDEEGNPVGGIRFLVDPRVVDGTTWIAGANTPGKHVYWLTMGRDFTADGTIEAAEVREGDLAPDGSGPLHLERGIEVGHIFQLGRKYAKSLGLTVLDENGKSQVVTMGSYGIGVSRVLAALAETNSDERGLAWPANIAPFDVHVLATGKTDEIFDTAASISAALDRDGLDVLFDDRRKVSAGVKFADAELVGIPVSVVVGRGLAEGKVEIRLRASGESFEVPVESAVERIEQIHRDLLGR